MKDFQEFDFCTLYNRVEDTDILSCKLGFWEVSGTIPADVIKEAYKCWLEYSKKGSYAELLLGRESELHQLERMSLLALMKNIGEDTLIFSKKELKEQYGKTLFSQVCDDQWKISVKPIRTCTK